MEENVKKHYPNALIGSQVTEKYLQLIANEYQSDLNKMLFATSVCSDDVNISTDFRRVLNRPFTMGGLGGLPYSGFTGMIAFSHHIPDGGDAFIFYGPHIGITDEGMLGQMKRIGQSKNTNSCGALMLALSRFEKFEENNEFYLPVSVEHDYQQTMLERSLMPYKYEILQHENPKKAITDYTYKIIDRQLKYLVGLAAGEFSCDRIFLLGGVIINTSPAFNDYVDVRNFDVLKLNDLQTELPAFESIFDTEAFKQL